jgi:tRNA pseudouridine38-40 synthase
MVHPRDNSPAATPWKLTLAYDGTHFHGWQVQPSRTTVQGTLADTIAQVTGEHVLPQGSGRTDAGVHALGQVASFPLAAKIPPENLLRALNRALPPAIRVLAAEPTAADFHARHSARRKTYEYRIFERRVWPRPAEVGQRPAFALERICSPFLAPYAWDCRWPLDLARMQQAAASFIGTHDFTSFAATDPDLTTRRDADATIVGPSRIKTIYSSSIAHEALPISPEPLLIYRVTGSGFLHHMVRNLVGTLVEIGRGSLAADEIPAILAARSRSAAGPTAPPQGLYLHSVGYDSADGSSHPGEATP